MIQILICLSNLNPRDQVEYIMETVILIPETIVEYIMETVILIPETTVDPIHEGL